jgi:FkbM family methyltransferase
MSRRDPGWRRHSIFAGEPLGGVKLRLVEWWRASPLSWRFNLTITGNYNGQRIRVPIIHGTGFQNIQLGELTLLRAFSKILENNPGSFVDVGVNLGQTLIKVKLIDRSREYVGFEPNPHCCHYAAQLIAVNQFENCSLVPVALSDQDAIVSLFAKSDAADPSASVVDGFRPPGRYRRSERVAVFRGDRLLQQLNQLSVLKIDVEGGELEVIAGLRETIARLQPYVFCEILPVFDLESETGRFRQRRKTSLLAMLRSLGYTLYRLLHDDTVVELPVIDVHSDVALCNYIFVPQVRLEQFQRIFSVVTPSTGNAAGTPNSQAI